MEMLINDLFLFIYKFIYTYIYIYMLAFMFKYKSNKKYGKWWVERSKCNNVNTNNYCSIFRAKISKWNGNTLSERVRERMKKLKKEEREWESLF